MKIIANDCYLLTTGQHIKEDLFVFYAYNFNCLYSYCFNFFVIIN
jgi:hypothetical protein